MSKISNALLMLFYLNNKSTYIQISELADYLEVSDREVRRYRDDLEMAGFYIESKQGRNGGYRLMNDVVLTMNINHIKQLIHYQTSSYDYLTNLSKEQFLEVIQELKNQNFITNQILDEQRVEKLIKINFSIKLKYRVEIEYQVNKSFSVKQLIEPYIIKEIRNQHYLFAIHDNILKTYRIDNIINIKLKEEQFRINQIILNKELDESAYGIYRTGNKEKVVFEIFGKMNDYTQEAFEGKLKIIEERLKSTIYEFETYNLHECLYVLLSMGSSIKIISPPAMIDIYRKEINKIKKYF